MFLAVLAVSCGTSARQPASDSDDTLNIGYGRQTKDKNTYSISKVNVNKDIASYTNIFEYLNGRVAGVQVIGDRVIIRGVGTINGDTDPLFIVDGVQTPDISYINPMDVEDITVLKDGSSSIYGVQGANGVILITTKK